MKTFKDIREGAENYTVKKGPYTRKVDGKTADKMKRQGWKLVAREEIEEVRQMKDPKKDVMVVKRGKTIVIDKSKEKEYLRKGWSLAEAVSPAQQAAIAIAKKEKGEKSKTEDKSQFIYAAKQAKKKGETTFVFAGKTYNCEEVLEDKEICPKCEGKGCDHCDNTGYHKEPTMMPPKDEAHKKGSKCKTESFKSFNEATIIPQVKDIVSKKQAKKIQGVMVDMFTASAISQIYDKVNDTNKTKMDKMKIGQLANLAMKLMKKEEIELEEKRFSAKRDAMKDMGKSGKDSADDDDYKATDDDRKAASKNVISQIRRGCDMPKGVMLNFKDGSSKNFPKKACQLVMTKFDSIKKPMVKRKFQDMVNQSFAGLKKALSMKG
tara:strand:+ start:18385 stop:19518 length:1134 start_codon:yes stop_codon:yes gene_type:complete